MFGEVICCREAGEAAANDGDLLVGFTGGVGAGEESWCAAGMMGFEEGGGELAGGAGVYPRWRAGEEHGGSWNCGGRAESSHVARSMGHGVMVKW